METGKNLEIFYVPASEIKPYSQNARKHPEMQLKELTRSIQKLGNRKPIEIDENNVIICGHARFEVYKALGMETVPVIQHRDMTEDQKKEYRIVDNELAARSTWDMELLQVEIASIPDFSLDIKGIELKPVSEKDDEVPENPPAIAKLGNIYQLGKHRVMCGDSTNADDVEKLMEGKKADMVFTDPPYGVSIGDKNKTLNTVQRAGRCLENIENDTLSPDALYEVLKTAFKNVYNVCADHASVYVTAPQGGGLGMMMMMMMMKHAGLEVRHILNWVKNSPTFSLGRLDYDYQHEPILFTWKKTHKKIGGGKYKTSCWFIDKPRKCDKHPTMKPIELVENAILNSSQRDDVLLDAFCGSGTSVIACEKTGRICYGMELDPHYIDVIIRRWEDYTGQKAVLQSSITGAEQANG